MEAICSSEMSAEFQLVKGYYNPEDRALHENDISGSGMARSFLNNRTTVSLTRRSQLLGDNLVLSY
jgi:hypothetical protein